MTEELLQIPSRIKELREILEIGTADMAKAVGVDEATYKKYESGKLDIPISILAGIASQLNTDLTVLLTGDSPRMDTHTVVRSGHGVDVERYPGYRFSSLAFNFKNREMEPLLVSLDPDDDIAPLVSHGGQEFNYVLEGTVRVTIGANHYDLRAGDSIYFDPRTPHGQAAVGGSAKFVTVINEGRQCTVKRS
jgi:quercetin dioxygenase-like cupin family protein/DNA-binding XRE family transcriptional regulator